MDGSDLRDLFRGHFRPTGEEFKNMWSGALVVLDANVLLDLYRTSVETTNALMQVLEGLKDRIRLPHQFAYEFVRNRQELLVQQAEKYGQTAGAIDGVLKSLEDARQHPFLPLEHIESLRAAKAALLAERKAKKTLIDVDPLLDRVVQITKSRLGAPPPKEQLDRWYEEAKQRHASKTPPGFKDDKKKEPDCWGDYVGWRQMIDIAKSESKSIVFVSGDSKDDWWWRDGLSEIIGPRRELIEEFRRETDQLFYMYSPSRFLEQALEFLKAQKAPDAVRELDEARLAAIRQGEFVQQAVKAALDGFRKGQATAAGVRSWTGSDAAATSPDFQRKVKG